eukprot:scaffold57769_cov32-Tisochrysis_lutea.AAC.6
MVQTGSAVPQTADPLSRVGCLDCAAGHRTIVSRPRAVPVRMGQCLPLPAQRAYCPSAVRGEDTCLRATGQRHSEVRRSLGGTDRARMIRSKAATGRGAPVKEGGLAWSRPPTSARTRPVGVDGRREDPVDGVDPIRVNEFGRENVEEESGGTHPRNDRAGHHALLRGEPSIAGDEWHLIRDPCADKRVQYVGGGARQSDHKTRHNKVGSSHRSQSSPPTDLSGTDRPGCVASWQSHRRPSRRAPHRR